MRYKMVNKGERNIVVDENTFGASLKVTPNLEQYEIRIDFMEAEKCPLKNFCVRILNQNVSSICEHLGHYPVMESVAYDYGKIYCEKDEDCHVLKNLKAGNQNLLNSSKIEKAEIPNHNRLDKSNAFLVLR